MSNFYIYGMIPEERKDFKIKVCDLKTKIIKESTITKILQDHKLKPEDIQHLIILVSNDKFDIKKVDINQELQTINNIEIIKLCEYMDNKYNYLDDDILIQDSLFTHSLINKIIKSKYKYFILYIRHTNTTFNIFKKKNENDLIIDEKM